MKPTEPSAEQGDVEAIREAHRRGQTAIANEGVLSPKQTLRNADRDFDAALDQLAASLERAERELSPAERIVVDAMREGIEYIHREDFDREIARAEAAERERDEERERFHRHVETLIEPQLLARIEKAERALAEMREALEFYADEKTWTQMTSWGGRILDDEGPWVNDTGSRARAALRPEDISDEFRLTPGQKKTLNRAASDES